MDTPTNNQADLNSVPANRRMVEELSSRKLVSAEAREYGLRLLYPAQKWGLWASRMLLVFGVALVLSGIVYFFAFNWAQITPAVKLGMIQGALLGCLGAAYICGLKQLPGKILLLCSTVFVGVFLAVFGQIYQTGADAYNLFMMWALLTLPWVLISSFAGLWVLWLVVANTFLILYWHQAAMPEPDMEWMIYSYLALFNGIFLGLREYLLKKGASWLEGQWTRVILVLPILSFAIVTPFSLIFADDDVAHPMILGALLSLLIYVTFFVIYRFKLPDMWGLAATVFSACILLEAFLVRVLAEMFDDFDALLFLLMGGITLGVFTVAIIILRKLAKDMEVKNV